MSAACSQDLPPVLVGPLLRRLSPNRLILWLVTSQAVEMTLWLKPEGHVEQRHVLSAEHCQTIAIGQHAWMQLIDLELSVALPQDTVIYYDVLIQLDANQTVGIAQWAPHLLYPSAQHAHFVLRHQADNILFGSCRKPHHPARDGLARADQILESSCSDQSTRPALLILCGDQVYADDVAGPMLAAIHTLIQRLGLYGEHLEGAVIPHSEALYTHPDSYYQRANLLPAFKSNQALRERFFGGVEKPIFTTANAHNHLLTLAEMLAMYMLVWSPTPWQVIAPPKAPHTLKPEQQQRWRKELTAIELFQDELPKAARLLAHLSTLMIFDDHDVTDDWNLSSSWERTVYEHPFSRRIVGNALLAYMLCQGWGNNPDAFTSLIQTTQALTTAPDKDNFLKASQQDQLIEQLLLFEQWSYVLPTEPCIIVLNTRTRRWRNRHFTQRPSGLMDWESLTELQHELMGKQSAIIVSPTPMFGVKLIEVIQALCTYAGLALTVDAENWMAHKETANAMLNIFRHSRTPGNYVILSGDVHYSFAYDVQVRDSDTVPHIWQITSSGIKNEFPPRLLDWLDRLNRWLYSPRSPLNWFTQRRDLAINPRLPDQRHRGERVWNGAGIGQIWLDELGRPRCIMQHNADGRPSTQFLPASSTQHG